MPETLSDPKLTNILLLTVFGVGMLLGVQASPASKSRRGIGITAATLLAAAVAVSQISAVIPRHLLPFGIIVVAVETAVHTLLLRVRPAPPEDLSTLLQTILHGAEGVSIAVILGALTREPALAAAGQFGGFATGILIAPDEPRHRHLWTVALLGALAAASVLAFRLSASPP